MPTDEEKETLRQQFERRARMKSEQCEFMDCPECGALLAIFIAIPPPEIPKDSSDPEATVAD